MGDLAAAGDPRKTPGRPAGPEKSGTAAASASSSGAQHTEVLDRSLGEFRLLRRLGRGGMADVYLAEQTTLQRNVAIKVLRPELMQDATYLGRFQREATAAAGLNHANIVQVYTVGEQEGTFYIAQEYVQGQNLREHLVRKGPPDLPLALLIMRQVAAALQAAHAAKIVHRDIKPENIMLTRKGEVKVADFGLAKVEQNNAPVNLTQVGTTMGTPLYMSPEQVNGTQLDHRSDLYSFGVTCYHMLSGAPPFRGDTAMSIAVQHLKETASPLQALRPDLPAELCDLVHQLMAKLPDERYESAAVVLKELKRIGQAQPKKDRPAAPAVATPVVKKTKAAPSGPARNTMLGRLQRFLDRPIQEQVPRLLIYGLVIGGLAAGSGWMLRVRNPLDAVTLPPGAASFGPSSGR